MNLSTTVIVTSQDWRPTPTTSSKRISSNKDEDVNYEEVQMDLSEVIRKKCFLGVFWLFVNVPLKLVCFWNIYNVLLSRCFKYSNENIIFGYLNNLSGLTESVFLC